MALTDKLKHIADAIRSKTGDTDEISLYEIEATIRGAMAVNPTPSYVVAEAERVSALVSSSNFNMICGADAHLYSGNANHDKSLVSAQYFGMGIKELKKRSNIDCIVLNGDYSYMSSSSYNAEQVKRDILLADKAFDISGTQIWCVGNHDWCYGSGVDRMLTSDELYDLIGSKSDGVKPTVDTNRCYGYVDFPTHKIRVVYLNTNDCKDGIASGSVTKTNYGHLEFISPTQFRWVADVALKFTESGWGVIFVSHHNLDYGYGWFKHFLKMLEAYRDGTNLTLWLTEYVLNGQTVGHNETFNFASMANRAEIICNIHGHNHNCAESKVSSSSDVEPWLWRFCVPNICANRYNESATVESRKYMGEFDENGNPVYWYKETGNAKATSFNVVSVDRENKIINAYIFGAGQDRSMYYGEYIPIEYSIVTTLSNVVPSASNPATITEGLSVALTFTASSGYALPDSVTVNGASYTWDKSSGTLTVSNPTSNVSVTVSGVEVVLPYVNQLPISTDTDGSIYNGKGWNENARVETSGAIGNKTGNDVTGFIPIGVGSVNTARGEQVIYLSGISASTTATLRIGFYASDKTTFIGLIYGTQMLADADDTKTEPKAIYTLGSDNYINKIDVTGVTSYYKNAGNGEVAFFRLSADNIDGNSIITVNEEIV